MSPWHRGYRGNRVAGSGWCVIALSLSCVIAYMAVLITFTPPVTASKAAGAWVVSGEFVSGFASVQTPESIQTGSAGDLVLTVPAFTA